MSESISLKPSLVFRICNVYTYHELVIKGSALHALFCLYLLFPLFECELLKNIPLTVDMDVIAD